MKNTKNTLLTVALLLSTSMMHAAQPEYIFSGYRFSGDKAVDHLIETGECRKCNLAGYGYDLRKAIATVNAKNNTLFNYLFGDRKIIDLADADLGCTKLAGVNLAGVNLQGANLDCAYLKHANLTDANLVSAFLSYACLAGANLQGANLNGANLDHADLADTNLTGASLIDTNLTGTKLSKEL